MKTDSRNQHEAFLAKRPACDGDASAWDIQVGSGREALLPTGFLVIGMMGGVNKPVNQLLSLHAVNDGRWHHIAWVRQSPSSAGNLEMLYVDGALDNSKNFPETADLVNQTPLVLGHDACECCDGTRPYSGAAADLGEFQPGPFRGRDSRHLQ